MPVDACGLPIAGQALAKSLILVAHVIHMPGRPDGVWIEDRVE